MLATNGFVVEVSVVFFLHWYETPPAAVNDTFNPLQKVVGPPGVIVAVGSGLTVKCIVLEVVVGTQAFDKTTS